MARFIIQPHERLADWVADEKGYFADAGLDYEIAGDGILGNRPKAMDTGGSLTTVTKGAFEAYAAGKGDKGERSDISCACHWAVNQAAASNIGRMWGKAYSVVPGAVMVVGDSPVRTPSDLAGEEIAVGRHSGSHFATVQALEPFLGADELELKFIGYPWQRVDAVLDGTVAAANLWGMSYYVGEQLGLRKVVDSTFMIGFMFPDRVDEADVERYFTALRRAQADVDVAPDRYKEHYLREIPDRYRDQVDVRLFGPGERVVFLTYTEEMFDETQRWIHEHELFDEQPEYRYDQVVVV
jgi:hypothetical protein